MLSAGAGGVGWMPLVDMKSWGVKRTITISPDPYKPYRNMLNSMFFDENPNVFTKCYCSCGRFADLDSNSVMLKKSLHKGIECAHCRNIRIAKELGLDDSEEEADCGSFYF